MKIFSLFLKLYIGVLLVFVISLSNTLASDNFNWNNIGVSHQYNDNGNDLEIFVSLDNIYSKPSEKYEVELTVDGKQFSDTMSYSSSKDELLSSLEISDMYSSHSNNYSNIDIRIIGDDNIIVFDGRVEIYTKISRNTELSHRTSSIENDSYSTYTKQSSHFEDWSNLDITADYDTATRSLGFKAKLDEVSLAAERQTNNKRNIIVFIINGEEYSRYFTYSTSEKSISAIFNQSILSQSRVDGSYHITAKIFENGTQVFSDSYTIKPSTNFYKTLNNLSSNKNTYTSSNNSSTSSTSNTYSSNHSTIAQSSDPIRDGEILAYRYIFRIEAQTLDVYQRITTLNKFIKVLETVRYTHNQPVLVDSMINAMKNRIFSY